MKTLHAYFSAKPSPAKATPKKEDIRAKQESTPATKREGSALSASDKRRIEESKRKALEKLSSKKKKPIKSKPEQVVKETNPVKANKIVSGRPARKRKVISYNEGDDEGMEECDDGDDAYVPDTDVKEDNADDDYISEPSSEDEPIRKKKSSKKKRNRIVEEEEEYEDEEADSPKRSKVQHAVDMDVEAQSIEQSIADPDSIQLSAKKNRALQAAKREVFKSEGFDEKESSSNYKQWDFLNPKFRRDKFGKRPNEEGYDSNSVRIEERYYKDMTPAEKQYWRMKKDNMDFILFFKMGKFYELFDDDADIGARDLGLNYMSGKRRHTGFPEKAFDKYATEFVRLGYKVGRVEQMETPKELAVRNAQRKKSGLKKEPVVRREMLQVLTPGTVSDETLIGHAEANYTLSLCEENDVVGVCFVDTSRSKIFVGQFSDDHFRSRLRTLVAQLQPTELVFPRDTLCQRTQMVLKSDCRGKVGRNDLTPGAEFWDAETTWMKIREGKYFESLPTALQEVQDLKLDVASSALGGILHYLRKVLLDKEQFSVGNFHVYRATDPQYAHNMVLDAQTLENLEVLQNDDGGKKGSLLAHVDHTATAFGRRLIKEWLMRPLARLGDINARLDAVDELIANSELASNLLNRLKKLPDLERLLTRVHANSIAADRGAIMYENVSSKKIEQFLAILKGFSDSIMLLRTIEEPFESKVLRGITTIGQSFPDITVELAKFDKAFNKNDARLNGFIVPKKGVNEDFDAVEDRVKSCKRKLDRRLSKVQDMFGDRTIKYKHHGKEKYQFEIKIETLKRKANKLPSEWMLCGSSKKTKRYLEPEVKEWVEELGEAEYERETILKDVSRQMFAEFCKHYLKWNQAVTCLAQLDCLISLSIVSQQQEPSVRPNFMDAKEPQLEIREAVHPTLSTCSHLSSSSFIPNDIVIGAAENKAKFLLVSGPNMGGKSTLLRQTCVTTILAQLGCYVPAEKCNLTPVDRIFTRVGANDRIMQGQSTFMVELQETGNILKHATSRSLIILDELGRGTSTFDGTAIAYSVIKYLLKAKKCMTLFSTHYHKLLDEFSPEKRVAMYHMACNVEKERVTFLYKFTKGTCRNSYGMNCAQLAGLPEDVVQQAKNMAKHFEHCMSIAHGQDTDIARVRKILKALGAKDVKQLQSLQKP